MPPQLETNDDDNDVSGTVEASDDDDGNSKFLGMERSVILRDLIIPVGLRSS